MQKIQRWELLVKERLDNGISVSQFCKEKGYTENMYYHWINQIHKYDPGFDTRSHTSKSAPQAIPFVEISAGVHSQACDSKSVPKGESDDVTMAIIETGTAKIGLLQNASVPFMRQLLEAVQHA